MATTRIMSLHINQGKTAAQCFQERMDYIMNPDKTDGGMLITAYGCVPEMAANEFALYRIEYLSKTGRTPNNEVIAYHVRQAFKPGEITPEEANEIGKELADRLTNGNHAYVVATHTDRQHIHNHILICATAMDGLHKYRDVKRSSKDLVQISDDLCKEHGLSIIREPKDKSLTYDKWQGNQKKITCRDHLRMMIDAALRVQPDGFDALMEMLEDLGCWIRRGAHISIKPPDGERFIRLESLGPEYTEQTLRLALSGDHVHIPKTPRGDYTDSQIKRLVNIEAKLREGKGKGYAVWAERSNIDAKAQSVIYLKEHHIGSIEELENRIQENQKAQSERKASVREMKMRMKQINQQRKAIRDYRRTKDVYVQYRESGWSEQFYQEHRKEIEAHKNAQAVYAIADGKMPTLQELTAEYDSLRTQVAEEKPVLEKLKQEITDLKNIRYNFRILLQDNDPKPKNRHRHNDLER